MKGASSLITDHLFEFVYILQSMAQIYMDTFKNNKYQHLNMALMPTVMCLNHQDGNRCRHDTLAMPVGGKANFKLSIATIYHNDNK